MFYVILTIFCLTIQVNSYVLLQVRKDDQNRSNVDALIHKVVPSEKFDMLAKKLAKKHFDMPRARKDSEIDAEEKDAQTKKTEKEHLDVSKTRKDGDVEYEESKEDKISVALREFVDKKPVLRAKDFKIAPKLINFRSNQQPSLMYEVDSKVLIRALQDFLSSQLVARYTDEAAKRAAVVYKTFRREMNNY